VLTDPRPGPCRRSRSNCRARCSDHDHHARRGGNCRRSHCCRQASGLPLARCELVPLAAEHCVCNTALTCHADLFSCKQCTDTCTDLLATRTRLRRLPVATDRCCPCSAGGSAAAAAAAGERRCCVRHPCFLTCLPNCIATFADLRRNSCSLYGHLARLIAHTFPPQEAQQPQLQVCVLLTYLRRVHVAQPHAATQRLPATFSGPDTDLWSDHIASNLIPVFIFVATPRNVYDARQRPQCPVADWLTRFCVLTCSERCGRSSISCCCRRFAFLPLREPVAHCCSDHDARFADPH